MDDAVRVIVEIIKELGFPAAVAGYFMWYNVKYIAPIISALPELKEALVELREAIRQQKEAA